MDLHRRIRTLRLRRGLTGIELARRAGVSPSYISLIEHGEKVPSEGVAVRLARVLGEAEDLYRVWAATSRMDDQTRAAVLRARAEEPEVQLAAAGGSIAEVCPHPACPMDPDDARSPARPPGRPRRSGPGDFGVTYRLADDANAACLHVPLLSPGALPGNGQIDEENIEALLSLDPRLLGRDLADDLVAVRLDEETSQEVACWVGAQDIVVVDRRPARFNASRIHGFRLDEGLRFHRACISGDQLVLLPSPNSAAPARSIAIGDDGASLDDVLFGTVIWSARGWR